MQTNIKKLPVGITGISDLLEMDASEVQHWEHYSEVRGLFKDYNYGAIKKDNLLSRLDAISIKCGSKDMLYFSEAIESAMTHIKFCY